MQVKAKEVGGMPGDAGAFSVCEVTHNDTSVQVRSSE